MKSVAKSMTYVMNFVVFKLKKTRRFVLYSVVPKHFILKLSEGAEKKGKGCFQVGAVVRARASYQYGWVWFSGFPPSIKDCISKF